ncbi:MAG: PTS sugar transporter subunit IIA [Chitinivibrionales bacterium]
MENDILTIEEVAEYLRVSERTVYDWAQKGVIPSGKLGTSWRFKRSEVINWVDQRLGKSVERPTPPPSVSLTRALSPQHCILLQSSSKIDAINELISVLSQTKSVTDGNQLADAVFQREQLMSTGIGLGIGLPHVRLNSVKDIIMALGVSQSPIEDYESLDGNPVRIIVMIAAGKDQHAKHVRLLSHVTARLKKVTIRENVLAAQDSHQMYQALVM